MSELWEVVKARRLDLGLTKSEAARRADVSRGTWHEIEAGMRTQVQAGTLNHIEKALELSPGTLRVGGARLPVQTVGHAWEEDPGIQFKMASIAIAASLWHYWPSDVHEALLHDIIERFGKDIYPPRG